MNKKLKIGIVGCGTIADIHAQAIRNSQNSELHSVYSRSGENAKRCGEKYNVKWGTDWETFISDSDFFDVITSVKSCAPTDPGSTL